MMYDFFQNEGERWAISPGDECIVKIDRQVLCTGYIDSIPISYWDTNHAIEIIGRSKTADLVDCSFVGAANEWKLQTIEKIVKALCLPFGINVAVDTSVTALANSVIETFKANEGDTVYDLISDLCRDNQILPLALGDGKLTLGQATTIDNTYDAIEIEQNAIAAEINQSNLNRYSNYYVKGQGIGGDTKLLIDFIGPMGTHTDTIVTRTRPLVLFSDKATDSGKCRNRAQWEATIRAGYSRAIKYTIPAWTQSNGDIWDINKLVRIYDTFLGIDDTMLISEIEYVMDEDGKRSIITVVDPDTYTGTAADIDIKTKFDV
jgi:prophage tail gpP-like protein